MDNINDRQPLGLLKTKLKQSLGEKIEHLTRTATKWRKPYHNAYTSGSLLHFVGRNNPNDDAENFETLKKIMKSGWISHPPHNNYYEPYEITLDWDGFLNNESLIIPNITCYADIPEGSIGIHISKYGKFGLAIDRRHLISRGARPVTYIPMHAYGIFGHPLNGKMLIETIEGVIKSYQKIIGPELSDDDTEIKSEPTTINELYESVENLLHQHFLAYLKLFDSTLPQNHPENYYMEKEWRLFGNLELDMRHVSKIYIAKGFRQKVANELAPLPINCKVVEI